MLAVRRAVRGPAGPVARSKPAAWRWQRVGRRTVTGRPPRAVCETLCQTRNGLRGAGSTVVVAATNHAELLDRAAWRRFQVRLLLNPPTRRELAAYIARFAATLDEPLGRTAETIAKSLGAISYAEAEEFCRDVRRRSTLALGEQPLKAIVTDRLTLWAERSHASARQETSVGGVSATPDPYPRA